MNAGEIRSETKQRHSRQLRVHKKFDWLSSFGYKHSHLLYESVTNAVLSIFSKLKKLNVSLLGSSIRCC